MDNWGISIDLRNNKILELRITLRTHETRVIEATFGIESLLDFTILYIQLLLWLCTLSPAVLMPVSWLLCHMLWPWLVTSIMLLWLCDCHIIFPTLHLSNNLKRKEKKKKRNINIDLAVLPSHDILGHSIHHCIVMSLSSIANILFTNHSLSMADNSCSPTRCS